MSRKSSRHRRSRRPGHASAAAARLAGLGLADVPLPAGDGAGAATFGPAADAVAAAVADWQERRAAAQTTQTHDRLSGKDRDDAGRAASAAKDAKKGDGQKGDGQKGDGQKGDGQKGDAKDAKKGGGGRDGLVAKKITNKEGHSQTVWVRPEDAGGGKKRGKKARDEDGGKDKVADGEATTASNATQKGGALDQGTPIEKREGVPEVVKDEAEKLKDQERAGKLSPEAVREAEKGLEKQISKDVGVDRPQADRARKKAEKDEDGGGKKRARRERPRIPSTEEEAARVLPYRVQQGPDTGGGVLTTASGASDSVADREKKTAALRDLDQANLEAGTFNPREAERAASGILGRPLLAAERDLLDPTGGGVARLGLDARGHLQKTTADGTLSVGDAGRIVFAPHGRPMRVKADDHQADFEPAPVERPPNSAPLATVGVVESKIGGRSLYGPVEQSGRPLTRQMFSHPDTAALVGQARAAGLETHRLDRSDGRWQVQKADGAGGWKKVADYADGRAAEHALRLTLARDLATAGLPVKYPPYTPDNRVVPHKDAAGRELHAVADGRGTVAGGPFLDRRTAEVVAAAQNQGRDAHMLVEANGAHHLMRQGPHGWEPAASFPDRAKAEAALRHATERDVAHAARHAVPPQPLAPHQVEAFYKAGDRAATPLLHAGGDLAAGAAARVGAALSQLWGRLKAAVGVAQGKAVLGEALRRGAADHKVADRVGDLAIGMRQGAAAVAGGAAAWAAARSLLGGGGKEGKDKKGKGKKGKGKKGKGKKGKGKKGKGKKGKGGGAAAGGEKVKRDGGRGRQGRGGGGGKWTGWGKAVMKKSAEFWKMLQTGGAMDSTGHGNTAATLAAGDPASARDATVAAFDDLHADPWQRGPTPEMLAGSVRPGSPRLHPQGGGGDRAKPGLVAVTRRGGSFTGTLSGREVRRLARQFLLDLGRHVGQKVIADRRVMAEQERFEGVAAAEPLYDPADPADSARRARAGWLPGDWRGPAPRAHCPVTGRPLTGPRHDPHRRPAALGGRPGRAVRMSLLGVPAAAAATARFGRYFTQAARLAYPKGAIQEAKAVARLLDLEKVVPDLLLRLSRARRIELYPDAASVQARADALIGDGVTDVRGFYERNRDILAAAVPRGDVHTYYHELAHSLDHALQERDWEVIELEWPGRRPESFARAFAALCMAARKGGKALKKFVQKYPAISCVLYRFDVVQDGHFRTEFGGGGPLARAVAECCDAGHAGVRHALAAVGFGGTPAAAAAADPAEEGVVAPPDAPAAATPTALPQAEYVAGVAGSVCGLFTPVRAAALAAAGRRGRRRADRRRKDAAVRLTADTRRYLAECLRAAGVGARRRRLARVAFDDRAAAMLAAVAVRRPAARRRLARAGWELLAAWHGGVEAALAASGAANFAASRPALESLAAAGRRCLELFATDFLPRTDTP